MVKVGKWIAKHRILMLIIGVLLNYICLFDYLFISP